MQSCGAPECRKERRAGPPRTAGARGAGLRQVSESGVLFELDGQAMRNTPASLPTRLGLLEALPYGRGSVLAGV